MPLRDHFHPPLFDQKPWDGFHGGWPMTMVRLMEPRLPESYDAYPLVHLSSGLEFDLGAFEIVGHNDLASRDVLNGEGGTATAVWAPPRPNLVVQTQMRDADEYEVRVHDARDGRHLVAAVEIVSPSNKDRPENRKAFVAKCAALLQDGVFVAIVDIVTSRRANLYGDLLDHFGQADPFLGGQPPLLIATVCRWIKGRSGGLLEAWTYPLTIGQPLPTLPLWLEEGVAVPLELEASYEETCRVLRIPRM